MKFDSKFFKEHLSIVKQDEGHYWVICTFDDNEYRFCSDNVQFCRRVLQTDIDIREKTNGVSYTYAAFQLWKECLIANGIPVFEKARKISTLNALCKAMNSGEPLDLEKVYSEHPDWIDIPDPESKLICHDKYHIVLNENGKYVTRKYKPNEVELYFEQMKKSD